MKLVGNWTEVIKRAWSVRLLVIAALLSAGEVALPIVREFVMIPAGSFALISFVFTFFALIARIVAQRSLYGGNVDG